MCGGFRDMQSRLPPCLLDDMKPHAATDGLQLITSSRHHVPATPAGLAFVAALEAELVQSTSPTSRKRSAPSSSTSSLPIAISPAPSSLSASSVHTEEINEQNDHISFDHTVKNYDRGAPKSTIFSTSLSPPHCSYHVMNGTLYRELYDDFLGVCFSCNRPLGSGDDIYMYRGDRAFCTTECRYKHIVADESLQCSIQINQQCVQASSPTNQSKFTPRVAVAILV